MQKKLYYIIEKELQSVDDFEETTGHKTVSVYEIINNEPKKFFSLDLTNDDNSEEAIQDYLDDNGFEDEVFTLIQL
jgi:hypothetical protein